MLLPHGQPLSSFNRDTGRQSGHRHAPVNWRLHPALQQITRTNRSSVSREKHLYSQREIAAHLGLHYTSVSRIIKESRAVYRTTRKRCTPKGKTLGKSIGGTLSYQP